MRDADADARREQDDAKTRLGLALEIAAKTRAELAEEIAVLLTANADDEAQRPNRNCCSHAIESWLRESAAIARAHTNPPEASNDCPPSRCVDSKKHSWLFDDDDPYVVCAYCHERRDAISGRVITKGDTNAR